MPRTILVEGTKTFRVTVPDEAKITFGPWSPGGNTDKYNEDKSKNGTLRIYENKSVGASILGVWSGVKTFRVDSIEYEEKTEMQIGSSVWKSDKTGYKKVEDFQREEVWGDETPKLADPFAENAD